MTRLIMEFALTYWAVVSDLSPTSLCEICGLVSSCYDPVDLLCESYGNWTFLTCWKLLVGDERVPGSKSCCDV